MVGQDQYPALGEARETAKLLPREQSPWWRDEGRHLLILCLFSIRGMRLAHMHNAKSREHAHTCRKARAIFKLRYKNKQNELSGTICLTSLPPALTLLRLNKNNFTGSLDLTRLPEHLRSIRLSDNMFSGEVDVSQLPKKLKDLGAQNNRLSGTVQAPPGVFCWVDRCRTGALFDGNKDLTMENMQAGVFRLTATEFTNMNKLSNMHT